MRGNNGIRLNQSRTVSMDSVMSRIGRGKNEELRVSRRRKSYLQKVSRVITPTRPNVRIDPMFPTACVDQERDKPMITITGREFDQPETDLSRDVYDMTIQEALLVHEVGHILYTDHDAFTRTLSRVDMDWKAHYKRVWNTLEDGAIEEALRQAYNVEDEIYVMNANLFAEGDMDEADADAKGSAAEGETELDLFSAVTLALSDMAVFDSGKFSDLRDKNNDDVVMRSPVERTQLEELVPEMKEVVKDVKTQSDPVERTERIYTFWEEELVPRLNQAEDQGQDQPGHGDEGGQDGEGQDGEQQGDGLGQMFGGDSDSSEDGEDGEEQEGQGGMSVMPVPKPDDTDNANVGGAESADELDSEEAQENVEEDVDSAADPDSEETDFDEEESGAGRGEGEESEGDSDDGQSQPGQGGKNQDGESLRDSIEENRRSQLRAEAAEVDGSEQICREIEAYDQILSQMPGMGAGHAEEVNMVIPETRRGEGVDSDRKSRVENVARHIKSDLMSSLRQERRSRTVKNQRRGRFDRSRMIQAQRGSPRVFEREREGDEKDYDCIIVLDRSGSMGGDRIEIAEEASAAMALALQECGVNVGVISLLSNDSVLESGFGVPVEDDMGRILSNTATGGTPLSEALALSRERLEERGETDHPFMIVITDGKPADDERYEEQLDKSNFPIVGIYVQTNSTHDEYFHRTEHVEDLSEMQAELSQLARDVMF